MSGPPPKRVLPNNTQAQKNRPDSKSVSAQPAVITLEDVRPFLEKFRDMEDLGGMGLPEHVRVCYSTDSVMGALKKMVENNLSCLPVLSVDKNGSMVPTDFFDFDDVAYVVADLAQESASMPVYHASVNSDLKLQDMQVHEAIKMGGRPRQFNHVGDSYTTALDLIKSVTQIKMRRCLVLDDASQIVSIVTRAKVGRLLLDHRNILQKLEKWTLRTLGLGHIIPICVDEHATGINALRLMAFERVATVTCVDGDGHYIGDVTCHDLRAMFMTDQYESTKEMYETVPVLLDKLRNQQQKEVSKQIHLDTPFFEALRAFVETGLHVLTVLSENDLPVGIVTLSDLLAVLPVSSVF